MQNKSFRPSFAELFCLIENSKRWSKYTDLNVILKQHVTWQGLKMSLHFQYSYSHPRRYLVSQWFFLKLNIFLFCFVLFCFLLGHFSLICSIGFSQSQKTPLDFLQTFLFPEKVLAFVSEVESALYPEVPQLQRHSLLQNWLLQGWG